MRNYIPLLVLLGLLLLAGYFIYDATKSYTNTKKDIIHQQDPRMPKYLEIYTDGKVWSYRDWYCGWECSETFSTCEEAIEEANRTFKSPPPLKLNRTNWVVKSDCDEETKKEVIKFQTNNINPFYSYNNLTLCTQNVALYNVTNTAVINGDIYRTVIVLYSNDSYKCIGYTNNIDIKRMDYGGWEIRHKHKHKVSFISGAIQNRITGPWTPAWCECGASLEPDGTWKER